MNNNSNQILEQLSPLRVNQRRTSRQLVSDNRQIDRLSFFLPEMKKSGSQNILPNRQYVSVKESTSTIQLNRKRAKDIVNSNYNEASFEGSNNNNLNNNNNNLSFLLTMVPLPSSNKKIYDLAPLSTEEPNSSNHIPSNLSITSNRNIQARKNSIQQHQSQQQQLGSSHLLSSSVDPIDQKSRRFNNRPDKLKITISHQNNSSAINLSSNKSGLELKTPPLVLNLTTTTATSPLGYLHFANSPLSGLGNHTKDGSTKLVHPRNNSSDFHILSPEEFKPKRLHQRFCSRRGLHDQTFEKPIDFPDEEQIGQTISTAKFKALQIDATSPKKRRDRLRGIFGQGTVNQTTSISDMFHSKQQQNLSEIRVLKELISNSKGFSERKIEEHGLPGGEDIDRQFRLIQKNIHKIEDKNNFLGQQSTFLVDFVSTLNKVSLPPKKLKYLDNNNKCTFLNVDNQQMNGTTQNSTFFTKIITTEPYKNNLLIISANNNQINDQTLGQIVQQLPPKIETLSMKHNLIANHGAFDIANKLQAHNCSLICIDLENNRIRDLGAKALFKGLMHNNTLSKLNLSQNMIGDMCAAELREMLENQLTLQELYLKWNNFRSEGGIAIAQGLKRNQALRVLDISYNSLEKENQQQFFSSKQIAKIASQKNASFIFEQPSFGECMSEALATNKKLLHLDMTSCNISKEDMEIIQSGLLKNHTLFGLHVANNGSSYVNESGFIATMESLSSEDVSEEYNPSVVLASGRPSAFTHSINGVQHTIHPSVHSKTRDNCWLCEGWELLEFNYDDTRNANQQVTGELYIHFDFEGYVSQKMKMISKNCYQIQKMCPPNRQILYFITEPLHEQIILDDNSPKTTLKKSVKVIITYQQGNQIQLELNQFNTIQTIQGNIFGTDYYQTVECTIREQINF